MRRTTKFLGAGLAAALAAGAANAAVTITVAPISGPGAITNYSQDVAQVPDSQILWDFDTIFSPGYSYSPLIAEATGSVANQTRAPKGDTTVYGSVNPTDSPATFTAPHGLEVFSFLVGSPDTFNRIVFLDKNNATIADLMGAAAFPGIPVTGSDIARRVTYNLGGAKAYKVEFFSNVAKNSFAFEFDRFAGVVPEPTTWALMLTGFFGTGVMLRRSRQQPAAVQA